MNPSDEPTEQIIDESNCTEERSTNLIDKILTGEKYLKEKKIDLKYFEDDSFSKKKKRAFTLGAIDGIGDISFPNAPSMCPSNPVTEPPILQLPCVTNLIKNIHVKVNADTDIDKLYKYRTQNSNKDILMNMKPLYSLPEKVMTYYMQSNTEKEKPPKDEKEEETNSQEIKRKTENEEYTNVEVKKYIKEETHIQGIGPFEECVKDTTLQKPIILQEKEKQYNELTKPIISTIDTLAELQNNKNTSSRNVVIEKNESIGHPLKIKETKNEKDKKSESEESETKVKQNKGNQQTSLKIIDNKKNKDDPTKLDINEIMSPPLINALKFLASDIS